MKKKFKTQNLKSTESNTRHGSTFVTVANKRKPSPCMRAFRWQLVITLLRQLLGDKSSWPPSTPSALEHSEHSAGSCVCRCALCSALSLHTYFTTPPPGSSVLVPQPVGQFLYSNCLSHRCLHDCISLRWPSMVHQMVFFFVIDTIICSVSCLCRMLNTFFNRFSTDNFLLILVWLLKMGMKTYSFSFHDTLFEKIPISHSHLPLESYKPLNYV